MLQTNFTSGFPLPTFVRTSFAGMTVLTEFPGGPGIKQNNFYTRPWAIIAFATLTKPAIFAPTIRLPCVLYSSAVV